MRNKVYYQYYVEGEDEKSLINALKTELRCVTAGKVETLNVTREKITAARVRTFKPNTVVILIFDTDVEKIDTLQSNIDFLKQQSAVKDVLCIPQVANLEEELVYSCNIKKITELTHSNTTSDYKRDLIKCNNLGARLRASGFEVNKMWTRKPTNSFRVFENDACKIKL